MKKLTMINLKALLGAVSSLATLAFLSPAQAETITIGEMPGSPLVLGSTDNAQSNTVEAINAKVAELTAADKDGLMSQEDKLTAAVQSIMDKGDTSAKDVVLALNSMDLDSSTARTVFDNTTDDLGMTKSEIAQTILTETYKNEGRAAAKIKANSLNNILGKKNVNAGIEAFNNAQMAAVTDGSELANIEPAAGGPYDA